MLEYHQGILFPPTTSESRMPHRLVVDSPSVSLDFHSIQNAITWGTNRGISPICRDCPSPIVRFFRHCCCETRYIERWALPSTLTLLPPCFRLSPTDSGFLTNVAVGSFSRIAAKEASNFADRSRLARHQVLFLDIYYFQPLIIFNLLFRIRGTHVTRTHLSQNQNQNLLTGRHSIS